MDNLYDLPVLPVIVCVTWFGGVTVPTGPVFCPGVMLIGWCVVGPFGEGVFGPGVGVLIGLGLGVWKLSHLAIWQHWSLGSCTYVHWGGRNGYDGHLQYTKM